MTNRLRASQENESKNKIFRHETTEIWRLTGGTYLASFIAVPSNLAGRTFQQLTMAEI